MIVLSSQQRDMILAAREKYKDSYTRKSIAIEPVPIKSGEFILPDDIFDAFPEIGEDMEAEVFTSRQISDNEKVK